jgi:hypothetical protein
MTGQRTASKGDWELHRETFGMVLIHPDEARSRALRAPRGRPQGGGESGTGRFV